MKQFKCTLSVLLVMMLAFTSLATAETLDRSILPADTHWVIHIDMNQFNKTWLKKYMEESGEDFFRLKRAKKHMSRFANINFFEDISGITVLGNKGNKHDMVVVCSGRFDQSYLLKQLRKEAGHYKKDKYKKYTLHQWERHNYGAFAGKKKLVYSRSEEAIKNVLDLMSGKRKSAHSGLVRYLEMIPENAFVSAAVEDLSGLSGKRGYPGVMLKEAGMASFIALEKNKDLTLRVLLNTESAEKSQQIEKVITGIIAVVRMQDNEKYRDTYKLLDALKIKTEGSRVNLSFSYPSEELVKILSSRAGRGFHFGRH